MSEKLEDDNKKDLKNNDTFLSYIKSFETHNLVSLFIAILSIFILILVATDECRLCFNKLQNRSMYTTRKKFIVHGKNVQKGKGYLHNVFALLENFGYDYDPNVNATDWDLLWAHEYPFTKMSNKLKKLKQHQKVNKFPGNGYIVRKVDLSLTPSKYVPLAFSLPKDKNNLLLYAVKNPNVTFVMKSNAHRQVKIVPLKDIDMEADDMFVQKYVDNPLLVDGRRFDIGIYTVITSVDPLRVYIYNGEALLRYCPEKYYPFDPNNLDKYVIGDEYLPTWKMPSLKYYFNELKFGWKESFNAYLRSHGRDPTKMWEEIEEAIRSILLIKEPHIIATLNWYKSRRNFFEMIRFDLVVDDDMNVYILEANMSPNLSSEHFPQNQVLYYQALYNIFSVVGITNRVKRSPFDNEEKAAKAEELMMVDDKNIAVFSKECASPLCRSSCVSLECHLCRPCLSMDTRANLFEAYKEHLHKGECKRIVPPTINRTLFEDVHLMEHLSSENQLMYKWFQGKCLLDASWC